jgi:hypothetical protein
MPFRDRNYGLHPDHVIEEIERSVSNTQMIKILSLFAVGGLATGVGGALAWNWLGKFDHFKKTEQKLTDWFLESGGRRLFWYTQELETVLSDIYQSHIEEEALKYERGIGGLVTGAAVLDAIVKEARNILVFVVVKSNGERPYVQHVREGWLFHQDKSDLFTLKNEYQKDIVRFERKNIANLFHLGGRPCIAFRIYPD